MLIVAAATVGFYALGLTGMTFFSKILPLQESDAAGGVLMAALPCGTMNVIFAEKYDCAPEFASRTVIQSLVLMIITLPLMILLTSIVFPVS